MMQMHDIGIGNDCGYVAIYRHGKDIGIGIGCSSFVGLDSMPISEQTFNILLADIAKNEA